MESMTGTFVILAPWIIVALMVVVLFRGDKDNKCNSSGLSKFENRVNEMEKKIETWRKMTDERIMELVECKDDIYKQIKDVNNKRIKLKFDTQNSFKYMNEHISDLIKEIDSIGKEHDKYNEELFSLQMECVRALARTIDNCSSVDKDKNDTSG